MRDGIERYLENVLCSADLSAEDERNIKAELREQLCHLVQEKNKPHEVYAMLSERFGNPRRIGRSIASARGRVRTFFKKQIRKLPLRVAVCLVLAFTVRYAVAQEFYVAGRGVEPLIPHGSHILVFKLARKFSPGDIVVFHTHNGNYWTGIARSETPSGWRVERRSENGGIQLEDVPRDTIVGRVILNTR